jgi:hypothetical protein
MKQRSQRSSGGADQHQFEPALPHHLAAEPCKHRPAVAAIGCIGFGARGFSSVRIGCAIKQPDEVEHVNRSLAIVVAKLGEYFLRRIDMACHVIFRCGRSQPSQPALPRATIRMQISLSAS